MKKLILLALLIPFFASSQTDAYITVVGESTKEIDPDEIELSIYLVEKENLKKENELIVQEKALKSTIEKYGIPAENLTVDNYYAASLGAFGGNSNRVRLSKTYNLKLTKLDILNQLVPELFQIGADNVSIKNLKNTDLEKHKNSVMKEALDNAREKARVMAEHMGKELGDVLTITEFHPALSQGDDDFRLLSNRYRYSGAVSRAVAESDPVSIRKISISRAVKVRFQLK